MSSTDPKDPKVTTKIVAGVEYQIHVNADGHFYAIEVGKKRAHSLGHSLQETLNKLSSVSRLKRIGEEFRVAPLHGDPWIMRVNTESPDLSYDKYNVTRNVGQGASKW